jgi:hypothetical protein
MKTVRAVLLFALCASAPLHGQGTEWFVAPGGHGNGRGSSPFGTIQDGLDAARPGDIVTVRAGTYEEAIRTVRHGTASSPIRLRGAGTSGMVTVTSAGRVLTVGHAHLIVEGVVFDGRYGADDTIRVSAAATGFTLRNCEVRRSSRDLIDMAGAADVTIDGCLIHHALNASGGRTDAHGIAAGPVRNLTIRDTEIHTFSGDGVQVDPGRSAPGWSRVTLDHVRIWLAPLPAAENGFAAGTVAGENAIDTKAAAGNPRASLTLRNVTASGFRQGLIPNMAAFNLKEHIDATIEGATVYDSEIAFRLRGLGTSDAGAHVAIHNAVIHDVATAYRYEDSIQNLRIWNNTVGLGVIRVFQAAGSRGAGPDVRNLLVLGSLPVEAAHPSNMAVRAGAFVDAAGNDYRLAARSAPIDRGDPLPVTTDRDGAPRPKGAAFDVGAYEWQPPVTRGP